MRHETRVWVLPVLIGIALCGLALVPGRDPEPEPQPDPFVLRPIPTRARNGYVYWAVFTRALPPPFAAGIDPRLLIADHALRRRDVRDAAFLMRSRSLRPAR